jgi:hypothetical protein
MTDERERTQPLQPEDIVPPPVASPNPLPDDGGRPSPAEVARAAKERAVDTATRAKDRTTGTAAKAKERATGTAARAKSASDSVFGFVKDVLGGVKDTGRDMLESGRESAAETYDRMWREYDDKTRFRRVQPPDDEDRK